MATAEILLLESVYGLGEEGDSTKVRSGYARNFLFPQKKAIPVSRANKKYIEALQKRRLERELKEQDNAEALKSKIEALSIAIRVKTGDGGKMFGSVTAANLLERLKEEGIDIDKKKITLYTPVKDLGQHKTKIKLHPKVTVELSFDVVSENPITEQ